MKTNKRIGHTLLRKNIQKFACTCVYCQETGIVDCGPDGRPWELDHILPRAAGGRDEPVNLVVSCSTCNQAKYYYPAAALVRVLMRLTVKPCRLAKIFVSSMKEDGFRISTSDAYWSIINGLRCAVREEAANVSDAHALWFVSFCRIVLELKVIAHSRTPQEQADIGVLVGGGRWPEWLLPDHFTDELRAAIRQYSAITSREQPVG